MLVTWEEKDVIPGVVCKSNSGSTTYLIGYIPFPDYEDHRYVLVDMNDGTVVLTNDIKEDFAEGMTDLDIVPSSFFTLRESNQAA